MFCRFFEFMNFFLGKLNEKKLGFWTFFQILFLDRHFDINFEMEFWVMQ